jgi:acyl carrier protein
MKAKIFDLIYTSVDELNREGGLPQPLVKAPDTTLIGSSSALDSLGLINLIVGVERNIEQVFGRVVALADDRALAQEVSPFTSIDTLAAYIDGLLQDPVNA